jgi:hypothetical protein
MPAVVHANPSRIHLRHQSSIKTSLAYRLKIALATKNLPLVELLEREQQQIESEPVGPRISRSLMRGVEAIKGFLAESAWLRPTPKFYEYANGTDRWWYTFDPQTGGCIYADSEAELQLWIKETSSNRDNPPSHQAPSEAQCLQTKMKR